MFLPGGGAHCEGCKADYRGVTQHDRIRSRCEIPLYAKHGIPEVWIFAAANRSVSIYREPARNSYGRLLTPDRSESISPLLLPKVQLPLSLALADLGSTLCDRGKILVNPRRKRVASRDRQAPAERRRKTIFRSFDRREDVADSAQTRVGRACNVSHRRLSCVLI